MENSLCLICKCPLENRPTVTVKSKGIKKLRVVSKRKNDGLDAALKNVEAVKLHGECRKNYTRRLPKSNQVPSTSLRSEHPLFDYKKNCLFCAGKITPWDLYTKSAYRVKTTQASVTLQDLATKRNDDWGFIVSGRVQCAGGNLFAVEARYHQRCNIAFRDPARGPPMGTGGTSTTPRSPAIPATSGPRRKNVGRKKDEEKEECFTAICRFIENNEECQFTLAELLDQAGATSAYGTRYLKKRLQDKYKEAVHFADIPGKITLVSFTGKLAKIVHGKWHQERKVKEKDEERRIVVTGAEIIRRDIRAKLYDVSRYPTIAEIESGGADQIPATLRLWLDTVVATGKKTKDAMEYERKEIAAAHSIISATRPRSFVSALQVGVAVDLHRRYGSKVLLDILHSLSVCSSYKEALKYEDSVVVQDTPNISDNSFIQYVWDNADFNTRTLEGLGTFHCLGGIMIVTPASGIDEETPVPRPASKVPAFLKKGLATVPIKFFKRAKPAGLKKVVLPDMLNDPSFLRLPPLDRGAVARRLHTLWTVGSCCIKEPTGWGGFMECCMARATPLESSSIIPLPFINLEASNPSTIYTCLHFAAEHCRQRKQTTCFVTFDQPLFQKACEIVLQEDSASPIANVVIRLGGFHLLMSMIGSIGYVMAGSGIEKLWGTCYAENTIPHMLSGKAFSRAMRALSLTHLALSSKLLDDLDLATKTSPTELYLNAVDSGDITDVLGSPSITKAEPVMTAAMQREKSSRTGALWVTLMEMVELIKRFVFAERRADWALHLQTVKDMIPYFHATGHLNYARSATVYLHQMQLIEEKMPPAEFDAFVRLGYFAVSRTGGPWSGIWTDMVIEQNLMRAFKSTGGLTRGRGITSSTLATWVRAAPVCARVREAVESFTGTFSSTSEQHKDLRPSRKARDAKDMLKMKEWLHSHSPFEMPRDKLVAVHTGVVGDSSINCDKVLEYGLKAMTTTVGQNYADLKLSRKYRVKPLSAMAKSVQTSENEEIIVANVGQFFHRLLSLVGESKLEESLQYELSPRPAALFNDVLMRKTEKVRLADAIESYCKTDDQLPLHPQFIIDGGFLLHRVIWPRLVSFEQIIEIYVIFIQQNYPEAIVVFDGYQAGPSTKDEEHLRRAVKAPCADMSCFKPVNICSVPQAHFLSNPANKSKLISLLTERFTSAGIRVHQAPADGDVLIVVKALEVAAAGRDTVVVGTDTDLLTILLGLSQPQDTVHLLVPGSGNRGDKIHHIAQCHEFLQETAALIPFLHAVSGSDTTSALYGKGKKRGLQLLLSQPDLRKAVACFNDSNTTREDLQRGGEKFILALYGRPNVENLNKARYLLYKQKIRSQKLSSEFNIAALPPTSDAARQHILRVFHQVQQWRGNDLPPTEWGWKLIDGKLRPVPATKPPAPTALLAVH